MENHQLLPFEKNRFYGGKLLTSDDFQTEQNYFNNKRRFLNKLLFGPGVLCGLSVFNLDDLSLMVESGAALDGTGREVVLEQSVVKKLTAIDGFEELETDEAVLCLKYEEERIQPVYVEGREGEGRTNEFNRCREGYRLFLEDSSRLAQRYEQENDFFSQAGLFEDEDYAITFRLPSTVCRGKRVRAVLRIEKKSDRALAAELSMVLQTPAYTVGEDRHELVIHTGPVRLEKGEVFEREYWLMAGEEEKEAAEVFGESGDISLLIDGKEMEVHAVSLKTSVRAISPQELVTGEFGKVSLEMRDMAGAREEVPLARLVLSRSERACLIDSVREDGVKRYIPVPAGEALRREYASYFAEGGKNGRASQLKKLMEQNASSLISPSRGEGLKCRTGLLEIPLERMEKKGSIRYSGEIIHGLGPGNVLVTVGMASLDEDLIPGAKGQSTIFGDAGLFSLEKSSGFLPVQTAVRVYNDRGCFTAAVRLLKDTPASILILRWSAIRLSESEGDYRESDSPGSYLTVKTPTAVLAPKESHYFEVRYMNMPPCSLTYSLTEEGGGSITENGVYTAPSREGVYEIRISCTERPEIATYAYAVVRRKEPE